MDTYVDHGIWGSRVKGPEMDRVLLDAKKGKFDILLVWRSDRLFRSLSAVSVEQAQHILGGDGLPPRDASSGVFERVIQRPPFLVLEGVALLDDVELDHRPIRQIRGLIEMDAALLDLRDHGGHVRKVGGGVSPWPAKPRPPRPRAGMPPSIARFLRRKR